MKPVYSTDVQGVQGEHTCPEVLFKLSELIKGLLTNTTYSLTIYSVFTVL